MAKEKKQPTKTKGAYAKRPMWQWLVIYLVVAIVVYYIIYLIFFHKSGTSGGSLGY